MSTATENRIITVPRSTHQNLPSLPSAGTPLEGGTAAVAIITLPAGTSVGHGNPPLRQSLAVRMEVTPEGYLVSSGDVEEDGYGATPGEAVWDFLTSLYDRYQSLARHANVLA